MKKKRFGKLQLRSTFNQIKRLESYLEDLQRQEDIHDDLFARIRLATNEAVTNAMVHGNREDPAKQVTITAAIEAGILQIEVSDEGNGFDPTTLPDPLEQQNMLEQSGRGVFLIKQYTDEVSYAEKGSKVTLRFSLE